MPIVERADDRSENRLSKIESELAVLKWMVGFVMALLSAVALKLFLH